MKNFIALIFFGIAHLWDTAGFLFFSLLFFAILLLFLGGCTPSPTLTMQQEQSEKIAFDFLAEEKFYNCESKTWVFPFGGPADNLTLEMLQPGEGWRPVTDFGIAAWWKGGEVWVVDIKDRLGTAGCVMWRIMERKINFGKD